ncbi:uncharacterized protein LOC115752824 [Rhodamnia argentea]|uniref:Uncharacterized protein LOC115752824 n=1 Tax=Rhodamnia argentea TaxID=178133 RepID=A0A8B8QJ41_9MYRT|nr:uncharacterized protein LOC115752824 [Rhodamnia argentea]
MSSSRTPTLTALSFASLSFFLFFFFVSHCNGVSQQTISTVCSQTQSDELCASLLNSDPRIASADLPLFSLVSVELTQKQAGQNYKSFSRLRDNTTRDPLLRKGYAKCVSLYGKMVGDLRRVHELSESREYEEVIKEGPGYSPAYDCLNGVKFTTALGEITRDMLIALEMFASVASYVAQQM